MADKEKKNLKDEELKAEENAENAENSEANEPAPEPETNELEKAKEEINALNDKYLRLCAEYDNFKSALHAKKRQFTLTRRRTRLKSFYPLWTIWSAR